MPRKKAEEAPEKGILTVKVYCAGTTPLLMNPKTRVLLKSLRTGVREQIKRDEEPESIAGRKVSRNGSGQIVIPADNLFSCLGQAGRKVKGLGRSNMSTATSTDLPHFFTMVSEELVLVKRAGDTLVPLTDDDWEVDERGGNNPADGVAISIVRPKFPSWGFEVTFELDETKMAASRIEELFGIAGHTGLGDFRPGKSPKGTFGQFELMKWQTVSRRSAVVEIEREDLTLKKAA